MTVARGDKFGALDSLLFRPRRHLARLAGLVSRLQQSSKKYLREDRKGWIAGKCADVESAAA
eukprot:2550865-Alexandrium_andersonii.AAC.1